MQWEVSGNTCGSLCHSHHKTVTGPVEKLVMKAHDYDQNAERNWVVRLTFTFPKEGKA